MTWARLEDRFPWHRKVRGVSDAAFRLHVSGICWSTEHLTDGHIPTDDLHLVSDIRQPKRAVLELEAKGLWDPVDTGWDIHDYLTYNLTAERVMADRAAAADRQRRAREAAKERRESQEQSRRDSRSSHSEVTVPPTRPDPTPSKKTSSSSSATADSPTRLDVEGLCSYFSAALAKNDVRTTVTSKWRTEARLMLDRDQRQPSEIRAVIDWATSDSFWRSNVLSVPKLREKYDQLRLAMSKNTMQDLDPSKEYLRSW